MSETQIRLGIFLGTLVLMAVWEALAPRRSRAEKRLRRWPINLGLVVVDTLFLRLTTGAAAYEAARLALERHWGVLHLAEIPEAARLAISLVVLDFAIYVQHVLSHALPVFWRLHRVHHTDLDFDTTTAVRFHPVEIFVSMIYKVALVLALGASPTAVLIFEIALNGFALFNHGNVNIPEKIDTLLRLILVTPDMHRVHHSSLPKETNSNFGFSVSWWDRLCGTYRAQPAASHETMEIGLESPRDPAQLGLGRLLTLPFHGKVGRYSLQGD